MVATVVVVIQIFLQRVIHLHDVRKNLIQTLILQRPIKSFHMRIVVRFSNSRMPVQDFQSLREIFSKFWTVVGLNT